MVACPTFKVLTNQWVLQYSKVICHVMFVFLLSILTFECWSGTEPQTSQNCIINLPTIIKTMTPRHTLIMVIRMAHSCLEMKIILIIHSTSSITISQVWALLPICDKHASYQTYVGLFPSILNIDIMRKLCVATVFYPWYVFLILYINCATNILMGQLSGRSWTDWELWLMFHTCRHAHFELCE